ncbi:hypothetical protein B0J11DRAFT_3372 [Dendryphion nanum]|uniref:CUE domain-containing protein n=1 Tax=Dendryphion nanum TaxID=256645 RepID=A0A9P9IY47_9PLEO|nr:hypothetical protein B0J11DRAFT_3372 [Dendryphion nanum]
MSLPPFAPFPTTKVRQTIPAQQWTLYVDSWTSLAELYLRLNDTSFKAAVSEPTNVPEFLISVFREFGDDPTLAQRVIFLRKNAFLLVHRIWSSDPVPEELLNWPFISNVSRTFPKSGQLRMLLQSLWIRKGSFIEDGLQRTKSTLIKNLDAKIPGGEDVLDKLVPLLKVSLDSATFMLTGSDFLDSLSLVYGKVSPTFKKKLVTVAYIGLTSLLEGPKPNYSLLSDHLYSLKTVAEQTQKQTPNGESFLADLVTNTPILSKIRDSITTSEGGRVKNIAASLSAFQNPGIARPKKLIRRKVEKGKGKAAEERDELRHGTLGEIHIHRMSLVTQIQDLFPDLGSGFVVKLLDEYNDNAEEVTAHLLEDSLPPHLASADRTEKLPTPQAAVQSHLPPRSTPPPTYERRNVFDNDEFDRLAVDTSRLHIGRKGQQLTADKILSDRSSAPAKSAILAALASFDSDDDERDDTYDVEDVGGTVDSAAPSAEEANADLRDKNEESLFRAYALSPGSFGRDSETRRGKARAALKSDTGMTDEAIEGWGIMVGRDPKRLRRLEAKFSTFAGQQRELASTAYRSIPAESEEDASGDGHRGGRGGPSGRGRGRGRGGGGRGGRGGGNVAGPSDDKSTQIARRRKEANKGGRVRAQRDRKLARGGLPG